MLHHLNHRKKEQQTNKKTKQKWLVLPGEICFYLLRNSTGAFCVLIKAPNNDTTRDLTL